MMATSRGIFVATWEIPQSREEELPVIKASTPDIILGISGASLKTCQRGRHEIDEDSAGNDLNEAGFEEQQECETPSHLMTASRRR